MFEIELIIYIKMDLALNNLQRLICHKTQPTQPSTKIKRKLKKSAKNSMKPQKLLKFEDPPSQISSCKFNQIATLNPFYVFFSFFLLYKIFLKLCSQHNLFESVFRLENCGTYCLKYFSNILKIWLFIHILERFLLLFLFNIYPTAPLRVRYDIRSIVSEV